MQVSNAYDSDRGAIRNYDPNNCNRTKFQKTKEEKAKKSIENIDQFRFDFGRDYSLNQMKIKRRESMDLSRCSTPHSPTNKNSEISIKQIQDRVIRSRSSSRRGSLIPGSNNDLSFGPNSPTTKKVGRSRSNSIFSNRSFNDYCNESHVDDSILI